MTLENFDWMKYAKFGLTVALAAIAIVGYVNSGVDERIDTKITSHEAEFEMKQHETATEIKIDVAALKEQSVAQQRQLDEIGSNVKHTQELVEQLIRER